MKNINPHKFIYIRCFVLHTQFHRVFSMTLLVRLTRIVQWYLSRWTGGGGDGDVCMCVCVYVCM